MSQVIGGIANLKINGEVYPVKGNWTFNAGFSKAATVVGADAVHGITLNPQPAMLSGVITNRNEVDLEKVLTARGAIINLKMAGPTGDTFVLNDATQTGDGNITTEEGEVAVEFQGTGSIIPGATI
jgi:hypothetical protein